MTVNNPPVFDQITSSVGSVTGDEILTLNDTVDYDGVGTGYRISTRVYYLQNLNLQSTSNNEYVYAPELSGKIIVGMYGTFKTRNSGWTSAIAGRVVQPVQSPTLSIAYFDTTQNLQVNVITTSTDTNANDNEMYIVVSYIE